ncbi:MAG TPA: phage holin family protein [Chitinophagaceae bacterium]|nr:phage holin family protein [Chitinophagaceae bacterium]
MGFLIRILFVAIISFALANVLPGIHVDTFWTALVFSVVLAILNIFVKPLLILFTLPVTILTLGLFLFIINAIVALLASRFVTGFRIDNFGWALLFSLLLSLLTSIFNKETQKDKSIDS